MTTPAEAAGEERLRRWRLVLGGGDADGTGAALGTAEQGMDEALAAVYGGALMRTAPRPAGPGAGLGPSAPAVARWLGDIRAYFPSTVVRVIQQDAIARLGLTELLLEPEVLDAVEPDVHLVATGKDAAVFEAARALADELVAAGLTVLYDDRPKVSPGVKFKDAELMGIPTKVVVGERGLAEGRVEVGRRGEKPVAVAPDEVFDWLAEALAGAAAAWAATACATPGCATPGCATPTGATGPGSKRTAGPSGTARRASTAWTSMYCVTGWPDTNVPLRPTLSSTHPCGPQLSQMCSLDTRLSPTTTALFSRRPM